MSLGLLLEWLPGDGTFSTKEKKGYSIVHIDLYNDDMSLGYVVQNHIDRLIKEFYPTLPNAHKKEFKNSYPKVIQHTKNSQKLRFSNIRLGRVLDELFNF